MATLDPIDPAAPDRAAAADDALEQAAETIEQAAAALPEQVDVAVLDTPRRLLLVHAHPDDESLMTGVSMAHYAAQGAAVTLVTCTLGEEGEIVAPDLAHLASDREDQLGPWRIEELAAACRELGVEDHRFLGGPGRWRDSGMMGTATNERPDCFWRADSEQATAALVEVVRGVRPQVAVTYDENGGYGHPDHIQAHRVTVSALAAAADPDFHPELGEAWQVAKLYYGVVPRSVVAAGMERLRAAGAPLPGGDGPDGDVPFGVPDEAVSAVVSAPERLDAKLAALRAHRSQVDQQGWLFTLAESIDGQWLGTEFFSLAQGRSGAPAGEQEHDLFAGL